MSVDSKFFRLLPGCEHSGFSINREGKVACLRSDRDERALVIVSEFSMPRVLVHERSLNLMESSKVSLLPPVWDPSGTSLVFGRAGIWTVSADGQGIRKISGREVWMPSAIVRRGASGNTNLYQEKNAYLTWLPDGKSVLFVESSDPNHVVLWQAAVDGSWERKLLGQVRTIQSFAVSPSGRQVAVVSTDGITSDLFLIDLEGAQATHRKIDLGEHRSHAIYRYPKVIWGPREDWFVFRGTGSGWSKHYRVVLGGPEGDRFEPLTDGAWEDGEMVLSPDGSQAILSSREGSPFDERLFRLDLRTLERQPLETGETGFFMPVAWTEAGFYYTSASINARGDLYHHDLDSRAVRRLTWSDEAAAAQRVEAVSVSIPRGDSEPALPALLYRPAGLPPGSSLPGVVWCHGGPVSDVSRGWSRLETWLASHGFAVLVPVFRGSATLGIPHMEAGLVEGVGKNDLADILAGGRWLASQPGIDRDRLAVGGRSWGGYLTLRAVTQPEHPFVCGWAGAGVSDWEIQQAETEVRYYDYQLLGGFLTDNAIRVRAKDRSPIHDIANLKVPLLITHGKKDQDVPFRQIEEFVQALRKMGAPLEDHLFFENEGHSNKEPANIINEYSRILAFFRRHLLPWDFTASPCSGQAVY